MLVMFQEVAPTVGMGRLTGTSKKEFETNCLHIVKSSALPFNVEFLIIE